MKKYNHSGENPEKNKVGEPAIRYEKQWHFIPEHVADKSQLSDQDIEQMRTCVRRGMQQIREGQFLTDEELDDFIFSCL